MLIVWWSGRSEVGFVWVKAVVAPVAFWNGMFEGELVDLGGAEAIGTVCLC